MIKTFVVTFELIGSGASYTFYDRAVVVCSSKDDVKHLILKEKHAQGIIAKDVAITSCYEVSSNNSVFTL